MTVVGFAIAPMAAVASPSEDTNTAYQLDGSGLDGSGLSTQANESGPFPEEICTDLLEMAHEEMPYDMIVWFDDLPGDFQPPGLPWDVVTPRSVGSIVVGMVPNQCEIQDPNDPTYDPIQNDDDEIAPDGGGDVQQGEDGKVLFIVNGTLDQTSEGPSIEGEAGLDLAENGTLDPQATLNDGEKDYGLDPTLQYWSDGTTYFETDVYVFESRLGFEEDCTGPECTFSTRGLPSFFDYPALPSHTDEDYETGDGSDGGDSGGDSGGADGGENGTDDGTGGTGGTGTDGDSDGTGGAGSGGDAGGADGTTETDDGTGGDGAGESGGDSGDGDGAGSSNDGQGGDAGTGGDGGDGGQNGGDADSQQQAGGDGDDGNQDAQQAAAADGSGLGIVVAMIVFILGAAAIAPRD